MNITNIIAYTIIRRVHPSISSFNSALDLDIGEYFSFSDPPSSRFQRSLSSFNAIRQRSDSASFGSIPYLSSLRLIVFVNLSSAQEYYVKLTQIKYTCKYIF